MSHKMQNMQNYLKIVQIHDYSCLNRIERHQINGQLPLHVHMHLTVPLGNGSMGMGAPVAQDVISHKALKMQQNG